ncbi:TIGR04104 family putative zinc finger protein [Paenibacillus sp. RC84]|uniref:TIGR04104 family putative zinc finger protein n=1 Tax=Paenibacillus sp. RC84 TaxID=3156252 RepID=UPI0035168D95
MKKKCKNCKTKFGWKKIFRAIWSKSKIICNHCKTENEISLSSKIVFFLVGLAPVFANFIFYVVNDYFFQIGKLPLTTTYMIWYWFLLLVSPYLVNLKK